MALGGRVAEDIVFGRISTGAQNDLERITRMAYDMVAMYGMNDKVGNVSYHDPQGEYGYGKPYSEKTAEMIDIEIRKFIDEAYARTKTLLLEKREQLNKIAGVLLEKEIIFQSDLLELLGKRPWDEKEPHAETKEEQQEGKKETSTERVPKHEGISLAPDLQASSGRKEEAASSEPGAAAAEGV
jgi:cell division protease FtsH